MDLGPETEVLEFKKTTGELKEGIVSLSSMLNKNGYCTLFFGVKDNGNVVGQQIGDRTLRDISQAIAAHLKPQVIPTITLELLDGCNVIKVFAQGTDIPYSAYGKYYMRSADEDRELSPDQLRALLLRQKTIDVISNYRNPDQNLTFRMLKTLYAAKNLTVIDQSFEQNTGLLNDAGQYNLVGGLLADKNDISIKVATFRGRDKQDMVRRNEYGYKCLLIAMDQVLNYVESINVTAVEINSHDRTEEKVFNMACFREAWINACLHTRWERMNPPAVYIYQDRIEIISTGGLPEDLTKEEFFLGISRPVNHKLQKIFGQLGYVEQTGHGIPLIVSHYGRQAFDIMNNYINVTIPFNRALIQETREVPGILTNDAQRKVYLALKLHPEYTIRNLTEETGLSDGYVRKIINALKEQNIIERIGSNKTGYWKVNEA